MPRNHPTRATGWAGVAALAALLPGLAAADSVTLTWTAPGDDGNVGRAATYELRYSDQPIAGQDTVGWWNNVATPAGAIPAPQSAGARESFTVTGLTTGATYYFVLRTSDEVPNVSGFSNVRSRQVGATALATPAGFTAQMASGGVLLSWQEPSSGAGEGYHLYRRQGASSPDTLLHTAPLGETSWTDATVVAGLDYEYRLATYLGSQEGTPALATISVPTTTLASEPTVITGYPNPARTHVTLRFRAEGKDGGPGHARIVIFDMSGHHRPIAGRRRPAWGTVDPVGLQFRSGNGRGAGRLQRDPRRPPRALHRPRGGSALIERRSAA